MQQLLLFALLLSETGGTALTPESVFAVITRKAGVAKGLAHNHFIQAGSWKVEMHGSTVESLSMTLSFPVTDLQVDPTLVAQAWFPALHKWNLLDEDFAAIEDKTRKKIAKAMLGKSQLYGDKHPTITARLIRVEATPIEMGQQVWPHKLLVALTIRGKEVEMPFAGEVSMTAGSTRIKALGAFKFSQFDFEPYSAMFGAISNQDTFYVVVDLETVVP